jgi:hypothetical protein
MPIYKNTGEQVKYLEGVFVQPEASLETQFYYYDDELELIDESNDNELVIASAFLEMDNTDEEEIDFEELASIDFSIKVEGTVLIYFNDDTTTPALISNSILNLKLSTRRVNKIIIKCTEDGTEVYYSAIKEGE